MSEVRFLKVTTLEINFEKIFVEAEYPERRGIYFIEPKEDGWQRLMVFVEENGSSLVYGDLLSNDNAQKQVFRDNLLTLEQVVEIAKNTPKEAKDDAAAS